MSRAFGFFIEDDVCLELKVGLLSAPQAWWYRVFDTNGSRLAATLRFSDHGDPAEDLALFAEMVQILGGKDGEIPPFPEMPMEWDRFCGPVEELDLEWEEDAEA